MKRLLFTLCLLVSACATEDGHPPIASEPNNKLVDAVADLCAAVEKSYAYFDKVANYWSQSCERADLEARASGSSPPTLDVLERLLDDLHDPHASLNTNDETSPRLVPSGSDLAFSEIDGAFRVVGIRPLTSAAAADIEIGDELVSFNQLHPEQMIFDRIHSGREQITKERKTWAINAVIAGRYNEPRRLVLRRGNSVFEHGLGDPAPASPKSPLTYRKLVNNVGYIRFNNSLGEDQTVSAFERAIAELSETDGMILDLRDTPGGGNTSVAQPILGHFVRTETPYQITAPNDAPAYERFVAPSFQHPYDQPVIALVGRWTGSMGEGMAIGLDGMGRATVLGTQMSRLAGGTEAIDLPSVGMTAFIPTYDLRHLDGTPRHQWAPAFENTQSADLGHREDLLLNTAIQRLSASENEGVR
ncbi:MAG: S41 family peptidase [Pseudomonadota bacterium]